MSFQVVGYRRVSTTDQAESGHSLDAQTRAIEEYCERKGWKLVKIYTDAGLSGSLTQRPGLQELLKDIEKKQIDVVVIHAIDRFYRSLSGLLMALDTLRQHGASLVSITESIDFTTPWGKLSLAVLGTLAEIYLDKLKIETRKGLKERAQKGLHNGSIPFGYCKGQCSNCADLNGPGYCPLVGRPDKGNGKTLIAHPLDAIGVRYAFKLSTFGASDRDIATALNKKVIRYQGKNYHLHPRRQSHHVKKYGAPVFQKDTIREILLRFFYLGLVPYYGVNKDGKKRKRRDAVSLYPGKHPALIPQFLFDKAQQVRKLRHYANNRAPNSYVYPLSGIFICGYCGSNMRASSNQQGMRYYRCSTRLQQKSLCQQTTVRADTIENAVYDRLRQISLPTDWQSQLWQSYDHHDEDKLNKRKKLQENSMRLKELYIEGDIDRETYYARRQHYRESLANLTTSSMTAMMATGVLIEHISEILATDEKSTIKKLLQALLAAVIVRGNAFDGWTPNNAFHPLLNMDTNQLSNSCQCGSDGA